MAPRRREQAALVTSGRSRSEEADEMGITDVPRETARPPAVLVACPACGTGFPWPPTAPCAACGADLAGHVAEAIFDLDRDADDIRRRRLDLVVALRASAASAAPDLVPPPPLAAPGAAVARPPRRSRVRPQVVLAGAGVALLLAAAVVFIAVTWPTWPAWAQAAFVAVLTGVGAVVARRLSVRELRATADAVGVLTVAVAAYALWAAHGEGLLGLDRLDRALWLAFVAAAVALVVRPFAVWASLRDAPRRLGVVAALVAGGAATAWLVDVVDAEPEVVVLAVAPTVALLLLLHARWVLRVEDVVVRQLVPVVPALLLTASAIATAFLEWTTAAGVAVGVAAAVGVPLLVVARRLRPASPWTAAGAVVATVWVVDLVTFALADGTLGALDVAVPRLVAASLVAAGVAVGTDLRSPPGPWRLPVDVAAGIVVVPAALWTVIRCAVEATTVVRAVVDPFAGWPAGEALTSADVLLAASAIAVVAVLLARHRRALLLPVVAVAAVAVTLAGVIAAAAAELLPMAAPLAVAVVVGVVAAVRWDREPTRWLPVAATHAATITLSVVDLDLFAVATTIVALHLVWVGWRHPHPVTAAAGVATGLTAVAATASAFDRSTATTALLVTVVAGLVMVWSQVTERCRAWRHAATDVVVVVAALLATGTALAAEEAVAASVQLAVVAVVAVVHAARPGRDWSLWVASVAVSGSVWVLLADRGVDVVEAYTVPSATALAITGAWRMRSSEVSSWAALSPALSMASLPTLVVLLDRVDPARVLLLVTGAVVVALVGNRLELAAPLAVGAVVAAIAALLQVHDWTADLPRWVTFAALGSVLVWTSATYEAQLGRARRAGAHLRLLR